MVAALVAGLALLGVVAWIGLGGGAAQAAAEAERLAAEGKALFAQGKAEAALARFRAALTHTPNVPPLCFDAGAAAEAAGRWPEAERWYQAAVDHQAPERDGQYEFALGRARLAQGNPAGALTHLEFAAQAMPAEVAVHRALQDAGRAVGLGTEIERRYTEWLRDHPTSADAHYLLARLLPSPQGRAGLLRQGLTREPEHYWCRYALGETLLVLKDFRSAAAEFRHAGQLVPGSPKPRFGLFRAQLAGGDRAGAEATLGELRRDHPGDPATAEAERLWERGE